MSFCCSTQHTDNYSGAPTARTCCHEVQGARTENRKGQCRYCRLDAGKQSYPGLRPIGKTNNLFTSPSQERRKVEDIYAASLRKLSKRPLDVSGPELGIFEHPWSKISNSMREIAASHETLSKQIEKDIEQPLRNFTSTNPEYSGIPTLQGNLGNMARELEEAQGKSDKLSKKGGKANAAKVDQATQALQAANSQVCGSG